MNKARKGELEDCQVKGVMKTQTKAAIVGETSPLSKLQQEVTQLTTLIKSAQVGPKKNPCKGFSKGNSSQSNSNLKKEGGKADH